MSLYHRSPLHPRWGQALARMLDVYQKWTGRGSDRIVSRRVGSFWLELDLNEVIDSQLYYAGTFDPESIRVVRALVHTGDTVVDVGANIGWFTLHLAEQVGPTGSVLAFEPAPPAVARLREHVRRNDLSQVEVIPLALGERTEGPRHMRIQSSYRLDGIDSDQEAEVATTTLDDYLQHHPVSRLQFIKIDTDGMEIAVLRGAEGTLRRYRPSLLFEVGADALPQSASTSNGLLRMLQEQGYHFIRAGSLEPHTDVFASVARIPRGTTLNLVAVPTT